MVLNESVGRINSKLAEVKVGTGWRRDGCNTFLLTEIGMDACGEQRPRIEAERTRTSLSFLSSMLRRWEIEQRRWLLSICLMVKGRLGLGLVHIEAEPQRLAPSALKQVLR